MSRSTCRLLARATFAWPLTLGVVHAQEEAPGPAPQAADAEVREVEDRVTESSVGEERSDVDQDESLQGTGDASSNVPPESASAEDAKGQVNAEVGADAELPPASGGAGEEPESQSAAVAKEEEPPQDPYGGLDHTGTPPPPDQETKDPKGKWDDRYDGRRKKKRAEDAIIWIPRAPLLPAHLVLNYGVRWPIVTGVAKAEEARLFHRVQDIFTFDDGKGGYYPTAFFDKGRGFWAGAHFYYNDFGREGHSVRATAGGGTNGWILATLTDSWTVFDDQRGTLAFNAMYLRAPNLAFTGLGPRTDIDDQVFFTQERLGGAVSLDVDFSGLNQFATALEYRHTRLLGSGRQPDLNGSAFGPLTDELTGFDEWFDLATLKMRLALDTRSADREFTSGSGLRWETWGHYNLGAAEDVLSYFRYGVEPTVMWDITGVNHVLSFSVTAEALSKTVGEDPPLSEKVSLGGSDSMSAFLPGRFRGDSALVYGVAYSWPVLAFADALLLSDFGTTYNGFYDDFSHDKMALSWGAGLRTSFSRSFGVELLFAWGTNRAELWNDEFAVENFRLVAGVGGGIGK